VEYQIQLPQDADGFTTFQCPYCREEFKLRNDEVIAAESNQLYCPICGLTNSMNTFYAKDIYEKALEIAEEAMYEMINKAFGGMKSSKHLKIDYKKVKVDRNKTLMDRNYTLHVVDVSCCNVQVKVRKIDEFVGIYCPYCGRDNIG
jgi:predicted RNA-binding Zn-ribbon protein involved in translation (DUF1610 family)